MSYTKEDILSLSDRGIDSAGINMKNLRFDVMLAAYLLDPTRSDYRLDDLCIKYVKSVLSTNDTQEHNDQISMLGMLDGADSSDNSSAIFAQLAAIEKLYDVMSKLIENNGQHMLYYDVELPLTEVLADLQLRGMYVDKEALSSFGDMLEERINTVRAEIYELSGEEFNINSPKQLGAILF